MPYYLYFINNEDEDICVGEYNSLQQAMQDVPNEGKYYIRQNNKTIVTIKYGNVTWV